MTDPRPAPRRGRRTSLRHRSPEIHVHEASSSARSIVSAAGSTLALLGAFPRGPRGEPVHVASFADVRRLFGGFHPASEGSYALHQFFLNGGSSARVVRVAEATAPTTAEWKAGIDVLEASTSRLFDLMALPGASTLPERAAGSVYSHALRLCEDRRAFLLVDPAPRTTPEQMPGWPPLQVLRHPNAALYYPWLLVPDPLDENRPRAVPPSGTLAGVFARTDDQRGVWKAPAGVEAKLLGAEPSLVLNDSQNDALNVEGINALRSFPVHGPLCWGSRTLRGADALASEWKYVPVRRLALLIEESLDRGLEWVAFEPNDEPLWSAIRLNVGAFLNTLFRQGAFQGTSPRQAYFVKCDHETTTPADVKDGIVNLAIGFAPLKPAEFVVLQLRQEAGTARP